MSFTERGRGIRLMIMTTIQQQTKLNVLPHLQSL